MEIFIHIGHGKTGSSAIQSFLATNRNLLLKYGVDYPEHGSFSAAKQAKISSGNGGLVLSDFQFNSNHDVYLFSNEGLYGRLKRKEDLISLIDRLPAKPVLICYTRDLFDYYTSSWGQSIKRGKAIADIDEHAKGFNGFLGILANYIKWADELGYELIIKNYSRHSDNLIKHFCSLIIPENSMFFSEANFDIGVVNRSLTTSEYKMQQLFNKFFPNKSSDFISDVLVNELPNIKSDVSKITETTYRILLSKYKDNIDYINSHIEDYEQISIDPKGLISNTKEYSDESAYCFSEEQLSALVRSISRKMMSMEADLLENKDVISRDNAWMLRDISMKYEKGEPLVIEDTYKLMELAVKLYPYGPFMNEKLDEFKRIIKNKED